MTGRESLGARAPRRSRRAGGRTSDDGGAKRATAPADTSESATAEARTPPATGASRARPGGRGGRASPTGPPGTMRAGAWQRLGELTPSLARAYERLSLAAARAGPLDVQQAALLKVALSVGRGSWRGTHAHARKAMESGVRPEDLRHVACLALPVLGLAAALDALRWVEEIIEEHAARSA